MNSQDSVSFNTKNWASSKTLRDISEAYQNLYEKKVDQDSDGDNDFADVMIARMIAAGMSREEAIRKVKNKEYNEEFYYEETEEEKRRNERRARVAELQASGRVMTSSQRQKQRTKQKRDQERLERLERLANTALDAVRGTRQEKRKTGESLPPEKEKAPEANRKISSKTKKDNLAQQADEILKQIRNEDYEIYDMLVDYLLENDYVESEDYVDTVIENMSIQWIEQIIEEVELQKNDEILRERIFGTEE